MSYVWNKQTLLISAVQKIMPKFAKLERGIAQEVAKSLLSARIRCRLTNFKIMYP